MRRLLWSGLGILASLTAVLSSAALSGKHIRSTDDDIQAKLLGAWRLVSLESQGADGQLRKFDRAGILVYTSDGHMSVQLMAPEAGSTSPSGPVQYEQLGYEAYYGRYEVDQRAHAVTHHVEGSLVRTLSGHDLTRMYQLSGKQLILKSSRGDEHWTIVWEHY